MTTGTISSQSAILAEATPGKKPQGANGSNAGKCRVAGSRPSKARTPSATAIYRGQIWSFPAPLLLADQRTEGTQREDDAHIARPIDPVRGFRASTTPQTGRRSRPPIGDDANALSMNDSSCWTTALVCTATPERPPPTHLPLSAKAQTLGDMRQISPDSQCLSHPRPMTKKPSAFLTLFSFSGACIRFPSLGWFSFPHPAFQMPLADSKCPGDLSNAIRPVRTQKLIRERLSRSEFAVPFRRPGPAFRARRSIHNAFSHARMPFTFRMSGAGNPFLKAPLICKTARVDREGLLSEVRLRVTATAADAVTRWTAMI